MLEPSPTARDFLPPGVAGAGAHTGNELLDALPMAEFAQLEPRLQRIHAAAGTVLFEADERIAYIYFPEDAVVSLLAVAGGRMTLEVGLVGREGMLGATVGAGHAHGPVRALVQRAGALWRMEADAFRAQCARSAALRDVLHRYTDGLLAQAIQIALCSRFHVLEARLARTLLVTRERLGSDQFHLTHEFLAHALGVRRVGVTKAASALQAQGLIDYSRGNIEILDAAGLAAVSCPCYTSMR
ncbi:MAG: Crp/Fnr family transcriptional regulator [Telluria sp.]